MLNSYLFAGQEITNYFILLSFISKPDLIPSLSIKYTGFMETSIFKLYAI